MKKRAKRTVTKPKGKSVKKTNTKKIRKKPVKKINSQKKITKKNTPEKPVKGKEPRLPTLMPNFDKLIGNGFEKGSTNLIVGNSGSGKSIFATQFLIGGIKKGEKCLYVTFEEKKERFYENMKEFGWDLEEYEKKDLFTFLEYSPMKVKTMLEEGGGAVENIIMKKKISRIVIDSITSFALLFDNELEKREAALDLFNMISGWDCTSLLTFEGEPLEEDNADSRTMEFESDSIILFYYLRDKGERHRYLEILKMRGTEHSKKIHRFHIGKNGIIVYPKPVKITLNSHV